MQKLKIMIACLAFSLAAVTAPAMASTLKSGIDAYKQKRYEESFRILKPLAKEGNSEAQNYVGLMYANGRGVEQSDRKAAIAFRKAARSGHAGAESNLNYLVANGRAVGLDNELPDDEDGCD